MRSSIENEGKIEGKIRHFSSLQTVPRIKFTGRYCYGATSFHYYFCNRLCFFFASSKN